jgi:hypothetical protein
VLKEPHGEKINIYWKESRNQIGSDHHAGWEGGQKARWMGRPYSNDLRERVVKAVIKRGLSRHERGLKVDYRTVWEFVHAEKLSYKKDADCHRTGPSRLATS